MHTFRKTTNDIVSTLGWNRPQDCVHTSMKYEREHWCDINPSQRRSTQSATYLLLLVPLSLKRLQVFDQMYSTHSPKFHPQNVATKCPTLFIRLCQLTFSLLERHIRCSCACVPPKCNSDIRFHCKKSSIRFSKSMNGGPFICGVVAGLAFNNIQRITNTTKLESNQHAFLGKWNQSPCPNFACPLATVVACLFCKEFVRLNNLGAWTTLSF